MSNSVSIAVGFGADSVPANIRVPGELLVSLDKKVAIDGVIDLGVTIDPKTLALFFFLAWEECRLLFESNQVKKEIPVLPGVPIFWCEGIGSEFLIDLGPCKISLISSSEDPFDVSMRIASNPATDPTAPEVDVE